MKQSPRSATGVMLTLALTGLAATAQQAVVPAPQPALDAGAAVPPPPPKPKWETSVGIGATITDGNSETLLFTANGVALRKWDKGEFEGKVDSGYGTDDGDQNVGFIRGSAQYNYLITDRWYGFLRVEALHDSVADIAYRIPLTAGVGYYLIKNDRVTLSGEVGPGYVWEKVGDDDRDYATIRFAEKFTWKFSDRARLWQNFEYQPRIDDWSEYFLTGEVGVEADITKQLALRVVFQDWYVSHPAEGKESNDLKLIAGLNYKFQ
jgi:putative salt-induced outer membrane protein YdiY